MYAHARAHSCIQRCLRDLREWRTHAMHMLAACQVCKRPKHTSLGLASAKTVAQRALFVRETVTSSLVSPCFAIAKNWVQLGDLRMLSGSYGGGITMFFPPGSEEGTLGLVGTHGARLASSSASSNCRGVRSRRAQPRGHGRSFVTFLNTGRSPRLYMNGPSAPFGREATAIAMPGCCYFCQPRSLNHRVHRRRSDGGKIGVSGDLTG